MPYHVNDQVMTLKDLKHRLESTDLIPSQEPLLEKLGERMQALQRAGVVSMHDLRQAAKTPKRMAALANTSGVPMLYLTLLRRTVEGFFPKPKLLTSFVWLEKPLLLALAKHGVKDTAVMYERWVSAQGRKALMAAYRADPGVLQEVFALSDLSRIQWVGPNFARVLIAAGYDSAVSVAKANPEALSEAIAATNAANGYYKGKVGLRDVKRLVAAAGFTG